MGANKQAHTHARTCIWPILMKFITREKPKTVINGVKQSQTWWCCCRWCCAVCGRFFGHHRSQNHRFGTINIEMVIPIIKRCCWWWWLDLWWNPNEWFFSLEIVFSYVGSSEGQFIVENSFFLDVYTSVVCVCVW